MLAFKKYTIQDTNGSTELDLSSDVSVKPEYKEVLLNDLSSFTAFLDKPLETKLSLELDGQELRIEKSHKDKSLKVLFDNNEIGTNVYDFLSEKLGTIINESNLKSHLVSPQVTFSEDLNTTAASPQNDKLIEIESRMKSIQEEIEMYQNEKKIKEDLNKKIENVKREKEKITQMIESVQVLINNREELKKDLAKFGILADDSALSEKLSAMKHTKLERLSEYLHNVRGSRVKKEEVSINSDPIDYSLKGKALVVLAILQLIISLLLYFSSLDTRIIYLGFISIALISILFGLVNFLRVDLKPVRQIKFDAKNNHKLFNSNEDKFFVDAAWVNALRSELNNIESTLEKRLNGKNLDQVMLDRGNLEMEYNNLEKELNSIKEKSLTSEEYYKKRRELDILKIEKENFEYSIHDK